jgi:hypothetical protein
MFVSFSDKCIEDGDILSFIAPSKINRMPGSTLSVAITNSGFSDCE